MYTDFLRLSQINVQQLQDREQKTLQTLQELDLEKETLQRELEDLEKEVREIDDLEKRCVTSLKDG